VGTFLLGGAAAAGALRSRVHHVCAFLALAFQGWVLWREHRALRDNQRLIDEIDRRLASPGSVEGGRLGQEVAG
jgi:hypothetical protein